MGICTFLINIHISAKMRESFMRDNPKISVKPNDVFCSI